MEEKIKNIIFALECYIQNHQHMSARLAGDGNETLFSYSEGAISAYKNAINLLKQAQHESS
jgi:hypothetical protein